MRLIVIVYHSGYGHTAKQAEAVARGALSVAGVTAALIKVEDIDRHSAELEKADAIVFGSPTYMGSASAPFKAFMNASSKVWAAPGLEGQARRRLHQFGESKRRQALHAATIGALAAQHGMIWMGLGLLPGNNSSSGSVEDLNRLGGFLGAMAQSNADQGPEYGPTPADLRTAEHLGRRVAETTQRWRAAVAA